MINYLIIHHTVTGHKVSVATMKSWEYTKVISWGGKILNGKNTYHTAGHNHDGLAVCLVGNFQVEKPNKKQLASLVKVLKAWRKKHKTAKIVGHRDLRNNPYPGYNWTACPGKKLYKLIPTIRKEVMGTNTIKKLRTEIKRLNKGWGGCKDKLIQKNKLIVKYQKEKGLNNEYNKKLEDDMAKVVVENQGQSTRANALEKEVNLLKDVINEDVGFWQYITLAIKTITKGKNEK